MSTSYYSLHDNPETCYFKLIVIMYLGIAIATGTVYNNINISTLRAIHIASYV